MNRSERINVFCREIWKWYKTHKRDLPWRDLDIADDAQRAYQILVSEVMLQQTQVSRVIVIYKRFLEEFPTLQSLSEASNRDVVLAWRGMGYNSRALRLRDAAREIIQRGLVLRTRRAARTIFPTEMNELMSIKGIGHYTAAAIRNFAFGLPTPCIDTNIRRILHRTFIGPENADGTWKKDDKYLLKLAAEVLEVALDGTPRLTCEAWHAALMDFGSLVCTKTSPKWEVCPLTQAGIMKTTTIPVSRIRKSEPGRFVGSKYIPNRIFRGRIVDELRDAPKGLLLSDIGQRICIDWKSSEHQEWLRALLEKLQKDALIMKESRKYVLRN
jgi:A/G-specific adenine glycosylase